jgi:ferredoxin/flavodoxin
MYTIVYFSPTGNVLHLAEKLAGLLGSDKTEILPMEFVEKNQLKISKHLILLFPIHGFNAPRTVKRFVKNLPSGLFELVSLLGVGCTTNWLNDAASSDLKKVLINKSYTILVDEILAMPLTFIMEFPVEVATKLIAESEKKIENISLAISNEIISTTKVKPQSHIINLLGKAESPAARLFGLELHADKNCTSCGICWSNCPEKNIQQNSLNKPKFGFKCIMCMRCIYNCPEKSISPRFSKFIPIKKGYSLDKLRKLE